MTDPEAQGLHDRLARLEAGVAAPVHRWWHHAFAVAGIGAVVAILVAVLWLASSIKNRIDRGRELLQAAQPVVVAQDVAHQLSEAALVAKYHLSTVAGAVHLAPKPGTKKKAPHPPATEPATRETRSGALAVGSVAPSPSDQPEQVETTILVPEKTVPRMPYGGTAIGSLVGKPSEEPRFELEFKPDPRPRFAFGGLSRAGGRWDGIGKRFGLFVEHDLLSISLGSNDSCAAKSWRCGRALVLAAEPFYNHGYAPLPGEKVNDKGVWISTAIDF
jgi:hypothetical protein